MLIPISLVRKNTAITVNIPKNAEGNLTAKIVKSKIGISGIIKYV